MAKKQTKTMKAAAENILSVTLKEDSEIRRELELHGLAATGAQAILWAIFRKALGGDVSAAKLIREISGENGETPGAALQSAAAGLSALSNEELRRIIEGENS